MKQPIPPMKRPQLPINDRFATGDKKGAADEQVTVYEQAAAADGNNAQNEPSYAPK